MNDLQNQVRAIIADIADAETKVPAMFRSTVRLIVQPIEYKLLVLLANIERAANGNQT